MNRFEQIEKPPVFVVGAARSGTSWVHDIFAAHPLIASAFETWLFTEKGIGAFFTKTHYPSGFSGLGRLLPREAMIDHARNLAEEVFSHAIKPEHRYFVEKSPNHVFHFELIREIFPQARFVHVLRDGRDVSVSVRAAVKSWVPEWGESFGRSVASQAWAWKNTVKRAQKMQKTIGADFLEMRYEALHEEPFANYAKLFDFIGAPYDDTILQQVHEKTNFEKNYKGGEEQFRRGGRRGDWQKSFNLLDALRFNTKAGDMLLELGYEDSRWWILRWP